MRITTAALIWLIVGVPAIADYSGGATTQPGSPGSARIAADAVIATMPDNTWVRLNPAHEPAGRNRCSLCLGGGNIFYFGGDRASHDGNDVELYGLAGNDWSRSWESAIRPTAGPDADESAAEMVFDAKTGRPWPVPTYQQVCYEPHLRSFLWAGHFGTWVFDPGAVAGNAWSNPAGPYSPTKAPSPHTAMAGKLYHTFYSPQLDAAVCMVTGRPFGVYLFAPKRSTWAKRAGDIPKMMQWHELCSTWVPSRKSHLISHGGRPAMWWYDASAEQFTEVKNVPESLEGVQSLAYDATNDTVIALEQFKADPDADRSPISVDAWAMSPKTETWEKLPRPAVRPTGFATAAGSMLVYDAGRNVFLFLNRVTVDECQTWAFRYKAGK